MNTHAERYYINFVKCNTSEDGSDEQIIFVVECDDNFTLLILLVKMSFYMLQSVLIQIGYPYIHNEIFAPNASLQLT